MKYNCHQQKVLCNWGLTLQQSSAVHIQALYSADVILPCSSSKLRLLVINLASVPGGQLVNSPTAQSLVRYMLPCWTHRYYKSSLKISMTKIIFILSILTSSLTSFSQTTPTNKGEHINMLAYLYELEQIGGHDSIVHRDSTYSYQVTIPLWWRIRETQPFMLGGTFPAIDSIENALFFKCFKKDKFKDFADFENWVIKDYSLGQSPNWSSKQKVLLKKELPDFKEIGNAYKVQLLWTPKIYECCYVLTETSSAFIWIDFTATQTTYTKNFEKFKQVLSLFKKL